MKTPTDGDTLIWQLLYRLRAWSETKNTYPLGACLITNNLWEIASFCGYTTIAGYDKKKMSAVVADLR